MFLVLLETSGNQNFIFSTNKLRENVGASELTYRVGTQWILEIISDIKTEGRIDHDISNEELRALLTDRQSNPPLEEERTEVELIVATSGKALLLTRTKETAQAIVRKATWQTQKRAPGIDLCGVFVEFDWNQERSLANAIGSIHKKHEEQRNRIPSPQLRFLRLPIVESCSNSGFPASELASKNVRTPLSAVSASKQKITPKALDRMGQILQDREDKRLARTVNELEEQFNAEPLDWLAVIHADGNGLGEIFLDFQKYLQDRNSNREYAKKLRQFSIALDTCTENAFLSALEILPTDSKSKILPVVPLILGGDDLTVICDGRRALEFTQRFLQAFERETQRQDIQEGIVPEVIGNAFSVARLSACAGIAIIKPHFPFSAAYELAATAIEKAKRVKTNVKQNGRTLPCSALDFHILRDASGVDLDAIREDLTVDAGKTKLYNRPYIVTPRTDLQGSDTQAWIDFHHWDGFYQRIQRLKNKRRDLAEGTEEAESGPELPISQINALRVSAYWGHEYAQEHYRQIRQRYDWELLTALEKGDQSLFAPEPGTEGTAEETYVAEFLDALEATEFVQADTTE